MIHLLMKIEGDVSDNLEMKGVFYNALRQAGATVLKVVFHEFDPQGLTVVALLSESHATLHTWPEHGYAMIDYFSCAKEPRTKEFTDVWFDNGFAIPDCDEMIR